jgi:hypothetical protein
VAACLRKDSRPAGNLSVLQVRGPEGQDLHRADDQLARAAPLPGRLDRGRFGAALGIPLKNLLRDLDQVQQVKGRLRALLPTRVDTLRFDALAPGTVKKAGDVSLTFRRERPREAADDTYIGHPTVAEFDAQGVEGRKLYWAAYGQQYQLLEEVREENPPRSGLLRMGIPRGTAALLFKAVALREDVGFDFELREVPLKRAPRRLEAARFPGHDAPVTVEATVEAAGIRPNNAQAVPLGLPLPGALSSPYLSCRITNHSQKAVEKVQLQLTCLDADGRRLEEREHTQRTGVPDQFNYVSPDGFDDVRRLPVVVEANGRATFRVNALPQAAKTVRVRVTGVGFTDATSWSR